MAKWLAKLTATSDFIVEESEIPALMSTSALSLFTSGVLLAQDFSHRDAYAQLLAVCKAVKLQSNPLKLALLGKFFQLVSSVSPPLSIYQETQLCLLAKQMVEEVPQRCESPLWTPLLRCVAKGVLQLVVIAKSRDSLEIVRKTLEGKLRLLGEDVVMQLNSEDAEFLSGSYGGKTEAWVTDRVRSVAGIAKAAAKAGSDTVLSALLYIAVKGSPVPLVSALPLLEGAFTAEQLATISIPAEPDPKPRSKKPKKAKPQAVPPTPAPAVTRTSDHQFPTVTAGLRWLHGKVLADVQEGIKVEIDQVAYECERLVFGQSAPLEKGGKQDLFEAFDELMGGEHATKDTVQCWQLLIRGFGRLRILDPPEWEALSDKLSRLSHRNQLLRDLGKKAPNRPKRKPQSFRTERRVASQQKRGHTDTRR